MSNAFSDFVLYFVMYSVFGWVCEVVYCSIPAKKFINRGFLAGPYCPLYGFGALIVIYILSPFKNNPPLLFVTAIVATSLLEYFTSWLMEVLFGIRWWDYSHYKFNINGRVCLKNSLLFGVLGVVLVYGVHVYASEVISAIRGEYVRVIASLIIGGILIDFITTLNTLFKLGQRLETLKQVVETAERYNAEYAWLDRHDLRGSLLRLEELFAETGDVGVSEALGKIYSLTDRKNPGSRLLDAFPGMRHNTLEEHLLALKTGLRERADKIQDKIQQKTHKDSREQADEGVETSFAYGLNFYKLFWIFYISCILGYIAETIFCFVTRGYIESRQGLIYGPFSPVYGFGAVIMTVFLKRLEKHRDLWIFIGSAFIGGAFEFLCSLFQEMAFGTVSWDYSQDAYSIGGRTCLLYMFFWGILGIFLIKSIYPAMSRFVERIPNRRGTIISWVLLCFMCFNIAISAAAVARWTERIDGIPAENAAAEYLDKHYPNSMLEEIYPNMERVDNK